MVKARLERIIQLRDCSVARVPISRLVTVNARDPRPGEERLGQQLLRQNRATFAMFGVDADIAYSRSGLQLVFHTSTTVGAFPLVSPVTGRADYGVIVAPRFEWAGIGRVLSHTGWKTLPEVPPLPTMPHSESGVPPWLISTIVIFRLRALLRETNRRFATVHRDRSSPRGHVRWSEYAQKRFPTARFMDVPCSFSELQDDALLLGAVHYVLRIHQGSLQAERSGGIAVRALLDLCESLLASVQHVPPRRPTPVDFSRWLHRSLVSSTVSDALAGMEWTVNERGLAGLSDLSGLPWRLPMEAFFESWVETVVQEVGRLIGGTVKAGRERKTIIPLHWEPPFIGSQRYLLPDVLLTQPNRTVIFDAKYKQHWEEIDASMWRDVASSVRESHREDLLQVLAYSTMAGDERVTCCLVYPCHVSTWERLVAQGRTWHRATLNATGRDIEVLLCAIPMGLAPRIIAENLCQGLR